MAMHRQAATHNCKLCIMACRVPLTKYNCAQNHRRIPPPTLTLSSHSVVTLWSVHSHVPKQRGITPWGMPINHQRPVVQMHPLDEKASHNTQQGAACKVCSTWGFRVAFKCWCHQGWMLLTQLCHNATHTQTQQGLFCRFVKAHAVCLTHMHSHAAQPQPLAVSDRATSCGATTLCVIMSPSRPFHLASRAP